MKVSTTLIIETLKFQIVAEAISNYVRGKTIEELRTKYGVYGFTMDILEKDLEQNQSLYLNIGGQAQNTIMGVESMFSCINNSIFLYNQQKVFDTYKDFMSLVTSEQISETHRISFNYPTLFNQKILNQILVTGLSNNSNLPFDLNNSALNSNDASCLTRTVPGAFFAKTENEAWAYGVLQSSITHGGIENWISNGFLSILTYRLVKENRKIKTAWKQLEIQDRMDFTHYLKSNIQEKHSLEKSIMYMQQFKYANEFSKKLMDTLNLIKKAETEDNLIDYDLQANFEHFSEIEKIIHTSIYISYTSENFDDCIESCINSDLESDILVNITIALFFLLNRDDLDENLFSRIEPLEDLENLFEDWKNNLEGKYFRGIEKDDISAEELKSFLQVKNLDKKEEIPIKISWWLNIKNYLMTLSLIHK